MRASAPGSAMRLALPELDDVTPLAPSSAQPAEALRLSPLDTTVQGPSPWCHAVPGERAHLEDGVFSALELRARDVQGMGGPSAGELDAQLLAVLSMTARFSSLRELQAIVESERGRWLRA